MAMKLLYLFSLSMTLLAQETILLYPSAAADMNAPAEKWEERGKGGVVDRSVSEVSKPSITVYLPSKETATGQAIVICPGGGYTHLAIDKEGHDVAKWLTTIGVAGIVLKYRLPGQKNMNASRGEIKAAAQAVHVAIEDAEEAMVISRNNAAKWNIKADKVGMMGFSAGGHLAAMVGMLTPMAKRPNFLVLGYPAMPKTFEVTESTPRTFLVHADDDRLAPAANSVPFYLELKKAKVPAELHIYANGGHGFGIQKTDKMAAGWTVPLTAWLNMIK